MKKKLQIRTVLDLKDKLEKKIIETEKDIIKYSSHKEIKIKEIPVKYIQRGDEFEAVFPDPDNASTIVYSMDAVTRALNEISDGDANKQNYSVYEFPVFDLIALDLPSSRYVSSTGQSFDDLTVSVNVSDYTNIEGGLGIFGSYTKKNYDRVRFFRDYIESFGYNFIQEN